MKVNYGKSRESGSKMGSNFSRHNSTGPNALDRSSAFKAKLIPELKKAPVNNYIDRKHGTDNKNPS